ncbi:MAG TPA: Uma2 family endonuclease [Gemmatimonadaceae bacterium]
MHMAQLGVWTLDDLDRLPDDGNRYELLHGELFVTPPPEPDHETAIARLNRILVPFVERHRLGLVFCGHPVMRTSESHVQPDLAVRQPPASKSKWESAPVPILVVEALSPSTMRRDRGPKREFYVEKVRVPDYWIVDVDDRSITVVRPGGADLVVRDSFEWSPPAVGATLEVNLDDVFGSSERA